jgi:hypothetical protein
VLEHLLYSVKSAVNGDLDIQQIIDGEAPPRKPLELF